MSRSRPKYSARNRWLTAWTVARFDRSPSERLQWPRGVTPELWKDREDEAVYLLAARGTDWYLGSRQGHGCTDRSGFAGSIQDLSPWWTPCQACRLPRPWDHLHPDEWPPKVRELYTSLGARQERAVGYAPAISMSAVGA